MYKRLCIPGLGTFEVVQHAPEFNVVDKLVFPPVYRINLKNEENLSDHQLRFLTANDTGSSESIPNKLKAIGRQIGQQAAKGGFQWNGIGRISFSNNHFVLQDQYDGNFGLMPVAAHRVLRENVAHSRLVGDREITTAEQGKTFIKKRSLNVIIGWCLLVIAFLLILFFLYKSGFEPIGAGLRLPVN
jgi:hypothetical protein